MIGPTLDPFEAAAPFRHVDGWWAHQVSGSGVVAPDGATDLIFVRGQAVFLAGPDTQPATMTLSKGTEVIGVRLQPGVIAAMLRDSAEAARDQRVPIDAIVAAPVARRLWERLEQAPTSSMAARLLAGTVDAQLTTEWSPDPVVIATVDSLRRGNGIPVLSLGVRQHRRRFTLAMGYGPKFFERICRLDRFTDLVAHQPTTPLAQLAANTGYHDQAHLARDCRSLTGSTPAELRAQHTA